ncbi:MAG: glycosyltransferase [Bacteroidetes bacterium]|nr:glycosyltransferase [Bacteroidota bacterium]
MNYPKISIVTPSYNQGEYLEETILSIVNQKYPNLEYIIIDGGSTDNSVQIIRKYEKYLKYWTSEKDMGQSDAINKGLNEVTGDLFNWINSDDLLEEGSLQKIANTFRKNSDKKIFCFALNYLKGNRKQLFKPKNNPSDSLQCFCEPIISQPATFFSVDAISSAGIINTHLHYSMDYELWLRMVFLFGNESIYVSDDVIASFRIHDEAKTFKGDENFVNDIGSIFYSLSKKIGLKKYSVVLQEVCQIKKEYSFELPAEKINISLAEHMIIHFLLKWKRNIFSKNDFLSSKLILNKIDFNKEDLSPKERIWLNEMRRNAAPTSWLEFRAKRKIRYILSK